ncbi:MAG: HAD family hydrolase [Prolixibacteraceae bacterium]|nr:HAD family hydrolase [Prolixibacteraceae bacterium]
MIDKIGGVIWDWNGTLLNDAKLAVETINSMLVRRNLPQLSVDRYKQVFTFPVKEYYRKIGFDFEAEPFEVPALEFIERYNEQVKGCCLHQDSTTVLNYFQSLGIRQFVLSAMQQNTLDECLNHYQINHFFDHVSGLDNHYAASKIENGHRLIAELKLDARELVLIGDTIHDYEVAAELGCQCILIANGHQSREILEATDAWVIDHLNQLLG